MAISWTGANNKERVQKAYAALGGQGDQEGIDWWTGQLDSNPNIAGNFEENFLNAARNVQGDPRQATAQGLYDQLLASRQQPVAAPPPPQKSFAEMRPYMEGSPSGNLPAKANPMVDLIAKYKAATPEQLAQMGGMYRDEGLGKGIQAMYGPGTNSEQGFDPGPVTGYMISDYNASRDASSPFDYYDLQGNKTGSGNYSPATNINKQFLKYAAALAATGAAGGMFSGAGGGGATGGAGGFVGEGAASGIPGWDQALGGSAINSGTAGGVAAGAAGASPGAGAAAGSASGVGGAISSVLGNTSVRDVAGAVAAVAGAAGAGGGSGSSGGTQTVDPGKATQDQITSTKAFLDAIMPYIRTNSSNPYGSAQWSKDANGNWTLNTALNQGNQAIFDKGTQGLAGLDMGPQKAPDLIEDAGGKYSDSLADAIYAREARLFEPAQAAKLKALETRLAERGFQAGDAGYKTEMDRYDMQQGDQVRAASTQAQITAAKQALEEAGFTNDARLDEFNAGMTNRTNLAQLYAMMRSGTAGGLQGLTSQASAPTGTAPDATSILTNNANANTAAGAAKDASRNDLWRAIMQWGLNKV